MMNRAHTLQMAAPVSGSCVSCGPLMAYRIVGSDTDILAWANSVEFDPKPQSPDVLRCAILFVGSAGGFGAVKRRALISLLIGGTACDRTLSAN
jgi:hypothetical protein